VKGLNPSANFLNRKSIHVTLRIFSATVLLKKDLSMPSGQNVMIEHNKTRQTGCGTESSVRSENVALRFTDQAGEKEMLFCYSKNPVHAAPIRPVDDIRHKNLETFNGVNIRQL